MNNILANYYTFKFIYLLTLAWKDQKAYKLGIIDKSGNKIKTPVTQEEKDSFTRFHVLVYNIKKLISKVPLSQTSIARYATSIRLIMEEFPVNMKNHIVEDVMTGGIDSVDSPLFAGNRVFDCPSDIMHRCKDGKKKYTRYSTYVGHDALGEEIRKYGRMYPKHGIVLKDSTSGTMIFLRKPHSSLAENYLDINDKIYYNKNGDKILHVEKTMLFENVIASRIESTNIAREKIKSHPMCFDFEESKYYFMVIFPNKVRGIGGVRVAIDNNKTKALNILYEKLEKFWRLDNPVLYPNEKL